MSLTTASIRFPVTVTVGVIIAVLGGLIALNMVPVQLTPEVQRPVITVTTTWVGASPEEIEKEIIEQQEEYLKSVEGVVEMNSQSSDSRGSITLEFNVGTDITGALVRVTNRLNEVPAYPDNADRPVITTSGPFADAIAWFVITGDSTVYVPHQRTFIEDMVIPRLERVEGVAAVNSFGGFNKELHVTFDPELLASSGITINQLSRALQSENRDISAGDFSEGKRRLVVRTISRFETIDAVAGTVVAVRGGVPIYVRDIADVALSHQKPFARVRVRGEPAIVFNAQRQVGANVLEVTEGLLEQLEAINREILGPRGMRAENVYRSTVYINSSIDLVLNNIYLGGALAIMVLFFFLRSPSSVMVIAVSIPISVITTFLAMYLFGRTINVISLAGMAFAVGMVVDSAIVVLENIYRHMQKGKSRWRAAADGTREVWGALLASTVTTIAVFLPVLFIQQRAGQLFRDIAIAICAAIAISLVVAITVIPALSSRILKVSAKLSRRDADDSLLPRVSNRIATFVDYINAKGIRRFVTIAAIIIVTISLSWFLLPPTEYLPNGNQGFVFAFMLPPPGYSLDEMVKMAEGIEAQIEPLWATPPEQAKDLPGGGIGQFFLVALPGQAFFGLSARDEGRGRELVNVANGAIFSVPGNIGLATQASLFGGGFAGTRSVRIDVTGPDLNRVLEIATQIFMQVGQVLPGSNSRPIPALDLGNPEVRVYPDRVRAADAGFSATDIGVAVNALIDGAHVSEYWYEGREIDLLIKGRDDWSRYTQSIPQLPLATPSGRIITLGDVADIRPHQGPVQINHVERQRAVSVETALPDDVALQEAIDRIQDQIIQPLRDQGQVGGLYDVLMSGTADDLSQLRTELLTGFNIAVILTFLLLAALFQSFTYPLVILVTVPLATFGGVLGLRVVQLFDHMQQLDILTQLGFVILVGTVINNSILIVHMALLLMREGTDPREAVKESVRMRVRPILMSTGTSVFAMMPLIIMPGAGSELYRGLGSVVVGGLAISAVFTLLVTPLVFSYMIDLVRTIRRALGMRDVAVGEQVEID
ncbi:MAG TPA: efflux RND transporter permease subunit [Acidobacteriota bacterium]|nr:efflux RND transporter permease subunit [Acidobacteriota bacterium]